MRSSTGTQIPRPGFQSRATPKLLVWLIHFVSFIYIVYTLKVVSISRAACSDDNDNDLFTILRLSSSSSTGNTTTAQDRTSQMLQLKTQQPDKANQPTEINDIVFGIAASAKLWKHRKNYIKLSYKPKLIRGIVWLDRKVEDKNPEAVGLAPIKISCDTSGFAYMNKQGHQSTIQISWIVSEMLRLGLKDVRWFVMGDDDTVFITNNLVRVLKKYDHTQYYYIGSLSESHLHNIFFSYGMAYSGGGFAISYPLVMALSKMQDPCIQRYPGLYGSDDRMHACMAELGVPLTKELRFHQCKDRDRDRGAVEKE